MNDERNDLQKDPEKEDTPALPPPLNAFGEQEKEPPKRPSGVLAYASIITAAFLVCFGMLLALWRQDLPRELPAEETTLAPEEEPSTPGEEALTGEVMTPSALYEACAPSVVSIQADTKTGSGVGSGFVLSSEGYIATARHVVADSLRLSVVFFDGSTLPATLVGENELTDLALLKVDREDLVPLRQGRSSSLSVGDRVYAIGTPASLSYSASFTSGDVSFLGRELRFFEGGVLTKKTFVIQTNAPVNPGNSGSPLFNERGELVGMVTLKLHESFEGLSFALPSDGILPILSAMQKGEEPSPSLLSAVSQYPASLPIATESAYDKDADLYGVRVTGFQTPGSDASKKLNVGDLVIALNDTPVTSPQALAEEIWRHSTGDQVTVTVWRSGQKLTFSITL